MILGCKNDCCYVIVFKCKLQTLIYPLLSSFVFYCKKIFKFVIELLTNQLQQLDKFFYFYWRVYLSLNRYSKN